MKSRCQGYCQRGAATLLVALVLMMSITIVTLAVARTQLFEQKLAGNQNWNTRLSLQAAAGMADAREKVQQDINELQWVREKSTDMQLSHFSATSDDPQISNTMTLRRDNDSQDFVQVQSTAQRRDGFTFALTISQWLRRLSVLTPLAENAPPLVLNKCISGEPTDFQLLPKNADSDQAGDAAWLNAHTACPLLPAVDTHHGGIVTRPLSYDLWSDIFSVDRETFTTLSDADSRLPANRRTYYTARRADLRAGRWARSLGNPSHHVILYVPAELGCPEFASAVRIFGLVFIDAACSRPVTRKRLGIYGSLMINGELNVTKANLQLSHIQHASPRFARLDFPVLRSVRVPGSWRDF